MLRKFLTTAALAGAALASSILPAGAVQRPSPEEQLERALAGRVAGAPVSCINLHLARNSRVIDHTAIIYEVGDTLYVNRPRSGAELLNQWDTQVVHTLGSQLCRVDTVRIVDSGSRFERGSVFLGDFVPYRRARRD